MCVTEYLLDFHSTWKPWTEKFVCITKQDLGAETHSNLNHKYLSEELILLVSPLCHCASSKVCAEQESILTQETWLSDYEPNQGSGNLDCSHSSDMEVLGDLPQAS